ncbi:MAG: HAD family hydrolase, partial [Symbiobacteriaceae bacterium]|nr:HAD family hydrolase [Symbiobacteriaceae bacterium]
VALITQHLSMEMYLVVDRVGFAMIMHREATKAAAVAELARIWGIDAADIVAFGDDLNDIDMLNHAGVGVAMGNAVEEVKAIADYICPSNEEDGLARWLQEYVLEL